MNRPEKIFFLFLLLSCCTAEAQYPSYQQSGTQLFPPLYRLLLSPSGLVAEQSEQGDMRWDSSMQHYRGKLDAKLSYPAMGRNGFSEMELTVLEGSVNSILGSELRADKIEDGIEMMPLGKDPKSRVYHFMDGKFIGYQAESVYAEREAYTRHDETLQYGKDFIRRVSSDQSSGHGSTTIYCKSLPDFFVHKQSSTTIMTFDPYDNLSLSEGIYSEQWDTCTCGGPQTTTLKIERNEIGQPVKLSHAYSREGGIVYENIYDYQVSPFSRFSEQVKGQELYAYFSNAEIAKWLDQHKATSVERISSTTKNYSVYDPLEKRNRLKPDSPSVSNDLYYIVRDHKRQPLVEWVDKAGTKGPFHFYESEETDSCRSWFAWSLPALVQTRDADHCAPLYDSQPQVMSMQWQLHTNRIVSDGRYKIHSYATAAASFTGTVSELLANWQKKPVVSKIQLLEDEHGLVRYGWDEHNIYKISYR